MNQRLQELTDLTIKEILNLEIVLPEIYRDIFYTQAKERGITLDDIDKEDALIYALKRIRQVQEETENSTAMLKTNVSQARQAIQTRDIASLTRIEEDMVQLENKICSLQQELYLDDLTRLHNRRWLFEHYLQDNESFPHPGVLTFIDINDFKKVNDRYGHVIGDKVLHIFGKVLKKIAHTTAIRFAGDEFLLLSERYGEDEMRTLLTTVNQNLTKTPFRHNDLHFYIDFSFGMSSFQIDDDFKEILAKADDNMYGYKKSLK